MLAANAESSGDEPVEFLLRQGPGAAFVAAGFQNARTFRQRDARGRRRIEQVHEVERGAEERNGPAAFQPLVQGISSNCPVPIRVDIAKETAVALWIRAANRVEHVDQR